MSYFRSSLYVTIAGIIGAFFLGGWQAMVIVSILGVLEVSLSFDNAVVNAKVLKDMDDVWRKRFITWGMLVAVFGMRLVFPLLIVGVVASINPWQALVLAATDPEKYKEILTSSHTAIMGFGGTFLWMVALKYFIDIDKDVHWIGAIERRLTVIGKIEAVQAAITLLMAYFVYNHLTDMPGHDPHEASTFLVSSVFGLITYILADGVGAFLGDENDTATKTGAAAFIYLELLDASFSFDGVIGAFALTNNLFIIAIGLGIGAMFVRSLTLMLVDKGTLDQFVYLEHGAFYAILTLAAIMYVNTMYEIPEVVTGLMGAAFIGLALMSSVLYNRKHTGGIVAALEKDEHEDAGYF